MARARFVVGVVIASVVLTAVPFPLTPIVRRAIPPVVAASGGDLLANGSSVVASRSASFGSCTGTDYNLPMHDANDTTATGPCLLSANPESYTVVFTANQTVGAIRLKYARDGIVAPWALTIIQDGSGRCLWQSQPSSGVCPAGTPNNGAFNGNGTWDSGILDVSSSQSSQAGPIGAISVSMFTTGACTGSCTGTVYQFEAYTAVPSAPTADQQGTYTGIAVTPDPINIATGNFLNHATDLSLPGRVLGLDFTRSYNSADSTTGPLGPSWTHTYNWSLSDAGATVSVRRSDGRVLSYARNVDLTYSPPLGVFDTLVKNGDGTFTFTQTNQATYSFSSAGVLTLIGEPAGNHVAFAYTAGNLTTITDTVGRTVTLSYNGANRLAQLQDPIGRKVTYAYDTSGRLATVTDKIGNAAGQTPSQHQWKYAYDGTSSHLTTVTEVDPVRKLTRFRVQSEPRTT